MERKTLFADIILPIPVPGFFTYRIPYELNNSIVIGGRVVVQFGRNKIYSGLVFNVHENIPQGYETKYILGLIDERPIVNEKQFAFWQWLAEYYMCSMGDIMNAALPAAFKLASETKIAINPDFTGEVSILNEKELTIVNALSSSIFLTIQDISKLIGQQKVIHIIRNLIEKEIIVLEEEIADVYKPKIEIEISLQEPYKSSEKELSNLLDSLNSKKSTYKQMLLLMGFLKLVNGDCNKSVNRSQLLSLPECSISSLNSLAKKEIISSKELTISRLKNSVSNKIASEIEYTEPQKETISKIENAFENKDIVLLDGVTGSGKTEIYIHFIEKVLKQGKQILYLLPEIALTTQIINRLQEYFGSEIGVYHSRFNEFERVEIWNAVLDYNNNEINTLKKYPIILGARSAVFMPFSNLGLIIVDEEHDASYKQYDPAPRYNARNAALYLANLHSAKTLLGSATPSIESYWHATKGKYEIVHIKERYSGILMPEITLVDLREQIKRKQMKSIFSSVLLKKIKESLENNEQVILFQNRRGFSPRIECNECNYTPKCTRCDVTLTYHKKIDSLKCHYCGYTTPPPKQCPVCESTSLETKGLGTEKVEEELAIFFPDITIKRMDYDSTRSKNSYQQIIKDFEDRKIQVLVGTQMVTKGLDFENVALVGVLNADNLISFPDFRAFERAYQMLVQVSGRAGRKQKQGTVIIQSFMPNNEIFQLVTTNNYSEMFNSQIDERKKFRYPPFVRLIKLSLKHKNSHELNSAASVLANMLRQKFNKMILGPEYPVIDYYIKDILIKLDINQNSANNKLQFKNIIKQFNSIPDYKNIRVIIDVDPQ